MLPHRVTKNSHVRENLIFQNVTNLAQGMHIIKAENFKDTELRQNSDNK